MNVTQTKSRLSATGLPGDSPAPLESVLCTEELHRRPSRSPDYQTENRALVALVKALADSPGTILQTLADTILEVFQADSAGLSLLTTHDGGKRFTWPAIAGAWKPHIGGGTPRDFGPCGDVLDCNAPLLFKHFERRYRYLLPATPPAKEALLIPFSVHGKAVGTIWAMAHDDRRRFDAEDLRQLESLGRFASAAYQAVQLRQADDSRRAAFNLMEDAVQSRQAAEKLNVELRESEQRLKFTLESSNAGEWDLDLLTGQAQCSVRHDQCFGATKPIGDWSYEKFLTYVHPDDRANEDRKFRAAAASGRDWNLSCRVVWPDGSVHWIESSGMNYRYVDDKSTRMLGMVRDVTERKRAEEALRDSERRFREMIDALPAAVYTTDAEGRLTHFNPAAVEFSGRTPELGTDQWCVSWKLYRPDGTLLPHDECPMAIALKQGREVRGAEAIAERPDGKRIWFQPYPTPLRDAEGRVTGGINMLVDITERKHREALLACQKETFEKAAVGAPLLEVFEFLLRAVETLSPQPALAAIHLLDESGERFEQTAAPSLPPAYSEAVNGMAVSSASGSCCAAVASRKRVVVPDIAASKEYPAFASFALPLGLRAAWSTPIFSLAGKVVGSFVTYYREPREPGPQELLLGDVVTRTAVVVLERKRAEEAMARMAAIVASSDDAIISKDLGGSITSWNHGAERLFGYTAQEAVGRPASLLIPPDREDEEPRILERIGRGESTNHYETVRRRKDGSLIDVSLTVSPIRDAKGRIIGASKIVRDISERKQAEVEMKVSLEKTVLLNEIHHRVKNNLQIIDSLLDLQAARIEDATALAALRDSQHRIKSMALIHQTLYESHDFARVNFGSFVKALTQHLRDAYPAAAERVALQVETADVLLPLNTAIPCGLIVNELVSNALKHAFPGEARGEVRVEVAHVAEGALLAISDNGVGIPAGQDLETATTLGMQLIRLLAEQVGATLEIRRAAPTRFALRLAGLADMTKQSSSREAVAAGPTIQALGGKLKPGARTDDSSMTTLDSPPAPDSDIRGQLSRAPKAAGTPDEKICARY